MRWGIEPGGSAVGHCVTRLLHDVRQLVRDQYPAAQSTWSELAAPKDQVPAHGESRSIASSSHPISLWSGMHLDICKAAPEESLHEREEPGVQRFSRPRNRFRPPHECSHIGVSDPRLEEFDAVN